MSFTDLDCNISAILSHLQDDHSVQLILYTQHKLPSLPYRVMSSSSKLPRQVSKNLSMNIYWVTTGLSKAKNDRGFEPSAAVQSPSLMSGCLNSSEPTALFQRMALESSMGHKLLFACAYLSEKNSIESLQFVPPTSIVHPLQTISTSRQTVTLTPKP